MFRMYTDSDTYATYSSMALALEVYAIRSKQGWFAMVVQPQGSGFLVLANQAFDEAIYMNESNFQRFLQSL